MRYYCSLCKECISKGVYEFSKDKYGKALCRMHQKIIDLPPSPLQENPYRNYYCYVCKESVTDQINDYSVKQYGATLCINHQKIVTRQTIRLSDALNKLDVKHILEYNDGFKHIDIAIEWAKIYLELDGSQHAFSPNQMCADDERDKNSLKQGFVTKRIPNIWIDKDVDKLALSVATLANKRYREILEKQSKVEKQKKNTLTNIVKSAITSVRTLSEKLENFE